MKGVRLGEADREFFTVLSRAIRMNPFSRERAELMRGLGSRDSAGAWSIDPHAYDMAVEVNRRMERIEHEGGRGLARFTPEDRPLMELVFLYQTYHRLIPQLDAFIASQLRDPGAGRSVPFAGEAIASLVRRGFPQDAALRSFAFAYQLRRAFFFIVASLIGSSDSIRQLRQQLWNCVFTFDLLHYQTSFLGRMEDFSTLLLGETGTGKGQAAAAIGRSGFIPFDPRANRFVENFDTAFVATNLSRFAESLIESELFGHVKGAFTGAVGDHKGLFERCSIHGSLFLDEVGDISLPVQVKLLDVLHDRTFCRVGDSTPRRFEGRMIAATNRPLAELRREGNFREDFFYRLTSNVVWMPPLRQRLDESPEELELLVSSLVSRTIDDSEGKFTSLVMDVLHASLPPGYQWPGNVRELEQVVRSILMTGEYRGNPLLDDAEPEASLARRLRAGELTADALLAGYCALLYERIGTYEGVARLVGLDRRTVKSHMDRVRRRSRVGPSA